MEDLSKANVAKLRGIMTIRMPFETWLSMYKEVNITKIETHSYEEFYDLLISM